MAGKYIKVSDVIKLLNDKSFHIYKDVNKEIKKEIEKLPSVDAVEVTRCENCKYNYENICQRFVETDNSEIFHLVVDSTGYCKWGDSNE